MNFLILLLAVVLLWLLARMVRDAYDRRKLRHHARLAVPAEAPGTLAGAWHAACRILNLLGPLSRAPTILAHESTRAGDRMTVRLPVGLTVDTLTGMADRLASVLDVRDVRVTPEPASKGRARVAIIRRDPFADRPPDPWPKLTADRLSIWEPIPAGLDEDGLPVTLSLPYRNLLLGGEPDAGKSVAQSLAVATAALDPTVKLYLLDGKWVELFPFADVAEEFIGPRIKDAINLFEMLRDDMDERLIWLRDHKRRKITPGDGFAVSVIVVDEEALFTNNPDKKSADYFSTLQIDLVARGRAAGYWTIAATQKPEGSVVPTNLRDLFGLRWAMRCNTPDASDTILGRGMASLGHNAATIDMATRGVGLLKAEGRHPSLLRSFYLDDDDLDVIATRAARLRAGPGLEVA